LFQTYMKVNGAMTELIKSRGVQHITLQPEFWPQIFDGDENEGELLRVNILNETVNKRGSDITERARLIFWVVVRCHMPVLIFMECENL